jgi:hypothetical protein
MTFFIEQGPMNLALLYKKAVECRYHINKGKDAPYHKKQIVSG